jgi:co-chaperonin GroES (HSP10)
MISNLKPSPGLIVIEPFEDEETSFKTYKEDKRTDKGRVLICGDSWVTENGTVLKCPVNPGDIILHSLFGHQDFKYLSKTYRIVKFNEILLKFENGDKN